MKNFESLWNELNKIAETKPQQQLIAAPADIAALQDISKSLAKIIKLLTQQNYQDTGEANQERKNQENSPCTLPTINI